MQAMPEPEFSVLSHYAMRPLPVALAHRLVKARPGDPHLQIFYRLYESLPTSDRTRCLAEMAQQSRLASDHSAPATSRRRGRGGAHSIPNMGQGERPS
jgi:hypothetical protein